MTLTQISQNREPVNIATESTFITDKSFISVYRQPHGGKIEISSKGKAYQNFYGEGSKWIWCFVNWTS